MVHWLWPMHASLYYVGFDVLAPQVSYGVQGGGIRYQGEGAFRKRLAQNKTAWAERIPTLSCEPPIPLAGWDDWDGEGGLRQNHSMRWRL